MAKITQAGLSLMSETLRVIMRRKQQRLTREGKLTTGEEWKAIFDRKALKQRSATDGLQS